MQVESKMLNFERIEIYDFTGRQVLNSQFSTNNYKLDISDYPSGIYLINVFADGKIITSEKIIKQ